MSAHTLDELYQMQALPLDVKISLTEARVRAWIKEYGESGAYISFSGGKDSTVLLDLVRNKMGYKNIPAVFVDVPTQYPELKQFVLTFDNVTILKPQISFAKVCEQYGFPMISKEVSEVVYECKKAKMAGKEPPDYRIKRLTGTLKNKNAIQIRTYVR